MITIEDNVSIPSKYKPKFGVERQEIYDAMLIMKKGQCIRIPFKHAHHYYKCRTDVNMEPFKFTSHINPDNKQELLIFRI